MKIYTSYFGNIRKIVGAGLTPISVARWTPRFFNGARLSNVAPTKYMLSDDCSHEEYLRLYDEILRGLDLNLLIAQLRQLSAGRDVALCCYEKPGDFCHRHLLAKWITDKTGIEVKEFGFIENKEPEAVQGSLF